MINRFSNFQQGQEFFFFSAASTFALGPTEPPIQKGNGALLQRGKWPLIYIKHQG